MPCVLARLKFIRSTLVLLPPRVSLTGMARSATVSAEYGAVQPTARRRDAISAGRRSSPAAIALVLAALLVCAWRGTAGTAAPRSADLAQILWTPAPSPPPHTYPPTPVHITHPPTPTPRPSGTAAFYVQRLIEKVTRELHGRNIHCAVDFAYCGRASCARHAASNTSVEIASCACQPIQASASMYAEIDWSDADLSFFLAQSATWVAIVEEYLAAVDASASGVASNRTEVDAFSNLTESMCSALKEKKIFESMSADRISLPCPPWDEQHPEKLVKHKGCETPLSVAVCSGAPCYNNKKSDGPLNVTCLCPVYPYDEANHTFGLIPP